jgi:hypothetical protein
MNRRQFLTFTHERRLRIVELSGQRLYMHLLDAALTCTPNGGGEDAAWGGESAAAFERRTPEQVFDEIDRDLEQADVLRINEPGWLAADDVSRRVDAVIDRFRARGGRVEIQRPAPPGA